MTGGATLGLAALLMVLVGLVVHLGRARAMVARELEDWRNTWDRENDAVLIADLVDGRLLRANAAATRLLGCSESELLGRRLPDLHPRELVARSAEVIADVWEKKGLVYADLPFVDSNGEIVDVEVSANVLEYCARPAILIHARDIRERKRLETNARAHALELESTNRQLRDAQSQLVQSEKMAALGSLVAGVAHEVNTPIGAIASNADVAKRALDIVDKGLADPELERLVSDKPRMMRALAILRESNDVTKEAADRVAKIVRSLRSFARLDEAERQKADLHEGLESTLTLMRHVLKHGVEVVKEYGDLPLIDCFPNQLNQVFMNLLVNAVHAMEQRGTLTIRTRVEGAMAVIELEDTGSGIAPENLTRIFDPGFTTKGVGVGTGLGLSISYRIVQDHRGTITARSEVGKGTVFTVRIPVE
jgi:PAS domain S-box-containing protein